jgi:hypothetical protein
MWSRKSMLMWTVLLLLVYSPSALCESQQRAPIKGVLTVDSTGVSTTQISTSKESSRIGLSRFRTTQSTAGGYIAPNYILPVTEDDSQWVSCSFSGTEWSWFVRKPGSYAAKALSVTIESNGGVLIDFENFDQLLCTDGSGEVLETRYAVSPPTSVIEDLTWMTPQELNNYQMHFDDPPLVQTTWVLWQKITVDNSTKAAEFEDQVKICFVLLNNFTWMESVEIDQNPNLK